MTLEYDAWPTFPPRNLVLNCTICRKRFTALKDFGWGHHSVSILHFARSGDIALFV